MEDYSRHAEICCSRHVLSLPFLYGRLSCAFYVASAGRPPGMAQRRSASRTGRLSGEASPLISLLPAVVSLDMSDAH
jgi:hypothetical protein